MHIAATSYSFLWSHSLLEGLRQLSSLGVRSCELAVSLPHVDLTRDGDLVAEEVRFASAAAGIRIVSVNPVELNLSSANSAIARTSEEQFAAAIDLAAALGADTVVVGPGRANSLCRMPDSQSVPRLVKQLHALSDKAEAAGVQIGLENVPFGFMERPRELVEIVETVGSPALGLTVDAANLHFLGLPVEDELRIAAPHIRLAHISDTLTSRFGHDHFGDGSLDPAKFFRALRDVGYRGDCVFELTTATADWERMRRDFAALEAVGGRLEK